MGALQNTTLSQDLSGLLNIILTDASNLANTVPDPLAQLGAFSSQPFLTAVIRLKPYFVASPNSAECIISSKRWPSFCNMLCFDRYILFVSASVKTVPPVIGGQGMLITCMLSKVAGMH